MNKKILFFDLETSPNIVYSWRIGQKISLDPSTIIEERKMICASWKWLDDDYVYNISWDEDQDDKVVAEELSKVLLEADVAIGHNGDKFDMKWIKTRLIYHKLPPIGKITTLDTLKIARSNFNFNSNKLDYIGQYLGVGQKIDTGGFSLWKDVIAGKKKSLDKMMGYCDQDVLLLEKVYKKLIPHAGTLNVHIGNSKNGECPGCGSADTIKHGVRKKKTGYAQRHQCKECLHVFETNKI